MVVTDLLFEYTYNVKSNGATIVRVVTLVLPLLQINSLRVVFISSFLELLDIQWQI